MTLILNLAAAFGSLLWMLSEPVALILGSDSMREQALAKRLSWFGCALMFLSLFLLLTL